MSDDYVDPVTRTALASSTCQRMTRAPAYWTGGRLHSNGPGAPAVAGQANVRICTYDWLVRSEESRLRELNERDTLKKPERSRSVISRPSPRG
jgi:hypothetical protein